MILEITKRNIRIIKSETVFLSHKSRGKPVRFVCIYSFFSDSTCKISLDISLLKYNLINLHISKQSYKVLLLRVYQKTSYLPCKDRNKVYVLRIYVTSNSPKTLLVRIYLLCCCFFQSKAKPKILLYLNCKLYHVNSIIAS